MYLVPTSHSQRTRKQESVYLSYPVLTAIITSIVEVAILTACLFVSTRWIFSTQQQQQQQVGAACNRGWIFIGLLSLFESAGNILTAIYYPHSHASRHKPILSGETTWQARTVSRLIVVITILNIISIPADAFHPIYFYYKASPITVRVVGLVCSMFGLIMVHVVACQNRFAIRNLAPQPKQRVVDTGLYAFVRHPMYASFFLQLIGMGVWLDGWISWGFVVILSMLIVARIRLEERMLLETLNGYREYMNRVPWRFFPVSIFWKLGA